MYGSILKNLEAREKPIDVIMVGLGFMGFGFISASKTVPGIRVPLVISRRPKDAAKYLKQRGFNVKQVDKPAKLNRFVKKGIVCVSSNLELIKSTPCDVVLEATGTVSYGTKVALIAIKAGHHLVTINPELQEAVGTSLKDLADKKGIVITDTLGDQPGSLVRLIRHAKLMGFKILIAGNMKRYMDRHATQEQMQPWADDKGLAVRQTVSFTDGTKQSIEMSLLSNYLDMDISEFGMKGPRVDDVKEALDKFNWDKISPNGIADYIIGKSLFPGIFLVVEHSDPHQQKYLRYLSLGDGPRYVLFEPYHLCHLELVETIASAVINKQEIINNGSHPKTRTIAVAKQDLKVGQVLDGIGGNLSYGNIDRIKSAQGYLPMGISQGAKVLKPLHQDQPIKLSDVRLPVNPATKLLGLVNAVSSKPTAKPKNNIFKSLANLHIPIH